MMSGRLQIEERKSRLDGIISRYRILRGFSKKRVDYSSAVKEFYVQDDLAYISCNVSKYSDVIENYSVREYAWPNRDFVQYVEDNAENIPAEYPIVLEMCGTDFSEKQQSTIKNALSNYYALKLGETQRAVDNSHRKAFGLLTLTVLSALTLLGYWMFFSTRGLLEEVLLILFWFFLWELGDVVVFERTMMNEKRNNVAQLASISIVFRERFSEEPLMEEVREEIIENIVTPSCELKVVCKKDTVSGRSEKIIPMKRRSQTMVTA